MARAAGNTAPGALSVRQTVPLVLVSILGALSMVLFHPVIGLPIAGTALAGLFCGGRRAVSVVSGIAGGVLTGLLAHRGDSADVVAIGTEALVRDMAANTERPRPGSSYSRWYMRQRMTSFTGRPPVADWQMLPQPPQ